MHKKDYKGRCEKKTLTKSKEICRTYDPIQNKYADLLEESSEIKEICCNVLLDNFSEGEYTSDFVCVKSNGDTKILAMIFTVYILALLTFTVSIIREIKKDKRNK